MSKEVGYESTLKKPIPEPSSVTNTSDLTTIYGVSVNIPLNCGFNTSCDVS